MARNKKVNDTTDQSCFIHSPKSKYMIMFPFQIFNRIDKNIKDINKSSSYINSIYQLNVQNQDFNKCQCSRCKAKGNYEIKGYYYRRIVINNFDISIRITRVKCINCDATHALFFEDMIPYYSLISSECLEIYHNNFNSLFYSYDVLYRLKKSINTFIVYLKSVLGFIEDIHATNEKTITSMNKSYLQIHVGRISFAT